MIFSAVHFLVAKERKELFHITAIHYGLSPTNYEGDFPKEEDLDRLFEWYKKDLNEEKDYHRLHSDLKTGELRKKLNNDGFSWVSIWFPQ